MVSKAIPRNFNVVRPSSNSSEQQTIHNIDCISSSPSKILIRIPSMPSMLSLLALAGLLAQSTAVPTQQIFDLPQQLDPLKRTFQAS